MPRPLSAIHLQLWRLKGRLTGPGQHGQSVVPAPPGPPDPATGVDGRASAAELWRDLLARYLPQLDSLTLLDVGCGRGELLHYLAVQTEARLLLGVDDQAHWDDGSEFAEGRIRLMAGRLDALKLPPASIDVIVCADYLHRLSPEEVADTLTSCMTLLRPGGSLVVRVPLITAALPSSAHGRFARPYAQLLLGERDLGRLLHARFNDTLPYVNWLTASSYVMLFHQSGLEALDVCRVAEPELAGSAEEVARVLPGAPPAEFVRTLEAHLVKPLTLADLREAGTFEDTRPPSVRERIGAT
jgi:2-polyprenyl-3-methyl-5-hydroxy-6-metoxy-1,4-benzoquinol methylase